MAGTEFWTYIHSLGSTVVELEQALGDGKWSV